MVFSTPLNENGVCQFFLLALNKNKELFRCNENSRDYEVHDKFLPVRVICITIKCGSFTI
jgi:hypothetical protein